MVTRANIGGSTPPLASLLKTQLLFTPPRLITFPLTRTTTIRAVATTSGGGGATMPRADSVKSLHHPSFKVIGGALAKFLPIFKTTIERPYSSFPLIGWNGHVETIFASFFRSRPDVKYRRECLRTVDDGVVSLDWVSGDHKNLPPNSPILILLPGLTGGSDDSYVMHMVARASRSGWRPVVFNSRGCSDAPVVTPRLYSAGYVGDLREVVAHVCSQFPLANVYAVGWSMGANILVQYLGKESHTCPLAGAVSLCNPFNLLTADEDFRKGFNNVYDRNLAAAMRKMLQKNILLFQDMEGEYNIPLAVNAKTVREFDEGLIRVAFGFKSVDEYYYNSCSSDYVKHVRIPLLCIQAENDPIAPTRAIPREDINGNSNCILIVTPNGGHLGWVAGDEAPFGAPWTDPLVLDFLEHLEKERSVGVPSYSTTLDDINSNLLSSEV